jgi:hypothetical protein
LRYFWVVAVDPGIDGDNKKLPSLEAVLVVVGVSSDLQGGVCLFVCSSVHKICVGMHHSVWLSKLSRAFDIMSLLRQEKQIAKKCVV